MSILAENRKFNIEAIAADYPEVIEAKQVDCNLLSNTLEKDLRKTFSHTAHEIRNPIAAMELHSRVILKKIELGEAQDAKTSIDCIMNSLEVLKNIADGLSSFSKDVQLKIQRVNVAAIAMTAMEIMRPTFEDKGIELKLIKSEKVVRSLDINKTQQVLINLLKNALEATEVGGMVSVWIDENAISVKDTGCGVSDRNKERIFYPNFTTKKTGSGIGLCESRKIARAQSCDVVLVETSDKGSTFALKLPA